MKTLSNALQVGNVKWSTDYMVVPVQHSMTLDLSV